MNKGKTVGRLRGVRDFYLCKNVLFRHDRYGKAWIKATPVEAAEIRRRMEGRDSERTPVFYRHRCIAYLYRI